jgi:hypothetical protein
MVCWNKGRGSQGCSPMGSRGADRPYSDCRPGSVAVRSQWPNSRALPRTSHFLTGCARCACGPRADWNSSADAADSARTTKISTFYTRLRRPFRAAIACYPRTSAPRSPHRHVARRTTAALSAADCSSLKHSKRPQDILCNSQRDHCPRMIPCSE